MTTMPIARLLLKYGRLKTESLNITQLQQMCPKVGKSRLLLQRQQFRVTWNHPQWSYLFFTTSWHTV